MIVIGAGRVGSSLAKRSEAYDIEVTLVTRTDGDAALHGPIGDPIVVATRNDDLLQVIERVPEERHEDLVFLQNGLIRGLLRNNHLVGCTRGLIYFAATERNGPIDPGGASVFCGPHALTMARWFGILELKARAVDWARFSYAEFEKLAWLALLGPLCDEHELPVGAVVDAHGEELRALSDEIIRFGRAVLNVEPPAAYLFERITEYSRSIPDYRASVKEWEWRNGAILREMALRELRLPRLTELLVKLGHKDRIPPSLLIRA